MKSNESKTIDLSKYWNFSPNENNIGISENWEAVDFDDSKRKTLYAGIKWEEQGYPDIDGYGWPIHFIDYVKVYKKQ